MEPWLLDKFKTMLTGETLACDFLDSRIHRYDNCWLVILNDPTKENLGRIIETPEQLELLLTKREWRVGKPLTDLLPKASDIR